MRIFFLYTSVSLLSFTGVWVTVSLIKSAVFWQILIRVQFVWSLLVLLFLTLPCPYQAFGNRFELCSQARSRYISLFSLSFIFMRGQSPLFGRFSFFLLAITRSGRLPEIKWCDLKILANSVRLILRDGLWIVYIVRMVTFQFFAQFLVGQLFHPVVSSLILFMRYFAAFAYYGINRFVSITT